MITLVSFWLRHHLKQGRLVAIYGIALLLFLLNAFIYVGRWQEDLEGLNQHNRQLQEDYDSVQTPDNLAGAGFEVAMPPTPLRFVVDSNLEDVPTARYITTRNAWLPTSVSFHRQQTTSLWDIDLSFIVTVVFTFLAVVLTFDSVCGEREQGTLKLLMTSRVSRYQVVVSKIIAVLVILALPLLLGLLADYLYLSISGVISFGAEPVMLLALFFVYTVLLLAFFAALGTLVSSLTRNSITSLVVLLLIWVLLVVVIPGVAKPLAAEVVKPLTPEEYSRVMDSLFDDFWEDFKRTGAVDRAREMAVVDNFKFERIWNGVMRRWQLARQGAIDKQVLDLKRQGEAARLIARASPSMIFQLAVSRVTATDLVAVIDFHEQAARYKQTLFNFLGEQDRQHLMRDNETDPTRDSSGLLYSDGRGYLSSQPLTAPVPRFEYREQPLSGRLADALPDTVVLFTLMMVALVAGVIAFNRYDVR